MRCGKCAADNRDTAKFCDKCGARLSPRCASCGAENRLDAKFCDSCGTAIGVPAAAVAKKSQGPGDPKIRVAETPAPENLEGERKTVTALFADIKGSTEMMEDLDPEAARAIIDPALKLMIEAAHRYDGYVVQSTGDGIFALFGAPVAHEDHPQRALYAALRVQEELRRYSAKVVADGGTPLQGRIGINTGEVVVRSIRTGSDQVEYTPIGHTTNLASRMQTAAPVGSIAVTEATRNLCDGYFILKALGATKVKGVSEPVNVYEVTGLGPLRTRLQRSVGRGLTRFVGREREMEAMRNAADLAHEGRGQIVAAMAEAGTGKSRLVFEFKAKNQSGWMVLETFSVSHGKASAYLPLIEMLSNYFGIGSDDDARRRREKVAGRLAILDPSLEDTRPYIFALLGIVEPADPRHDWVQNLDRLEEYLRHMQRTDSLAQMDPGIQRRRTLEAIKRILLRESLNQPLMVIFEDLHWIDEATQEFLNLLADSIANARLLLLVNYRPEYAHGWNSKTYYAQLRLDPLGKESADEMLSALLGDGADLAPLKRVIIERTEGNPFFLEEIVQVLLDEGALVRNGGLHLIKPIAELKIPPTVQAILAARIDRLASEAKDLLQTLSIIGREFPMSLIRAVLPRSDTELNRLLRDLQLGEFIYEQPAVGDTEYVFKHALTQEVAYNSVLIERRKQLHGCVGDAIEALSGAELDDHLAELAHHYGRSAKMMKAAEYLGRAAEQLMARSVLAGAAASVEAGLKSISAIEAGPERTRIELRLQILRGQLCQTTIGLGAQAAIDAFIRARELSANSSDEQLLFSVLEGLRKSRLFRLELESARQLAQEQLAVAERSADPIRLGLALGALTETSVWMGELVAAQGYATPMLSLPASEESGQRLVDRVVALSQIEHILLLLGFPDQALRRRQETLAWARKFSQPNLTATAAVVATIPALWRRSAPETAELSQTVIDLGNEHGFPSLLAIASICKGWALSVQGHDESGIEQMRRGIEGAESAGVTSPTFVLFPLAEEYLRLGHPQKCAELVEQMLRNVQSTGQRLQEAEIHRLKGELLLARGIVNTAEAERCFREAIRIASRQSAKFWELRATTSLARLLRETDRRDEARAILADIYGWFTEGFDTADLIDAKALLDQLSP